MKFKQLDSYRSDILGVLENVTKEEAEIIPQGFHNNIHWNLGHIYLDQYLWIEALIKEKSGFLNTIILGLGLEHRLLTSPRRLLPLKS